MSGCVLILLAVSFDGSGVGARTGTAKPYSLEQLAIRLALAGAAEDAVRGQNRRGLREQTEHHRTRPGRVGQAPAYPCARGASRYVNVLRV